METALQEVDALVSAISENPNIPSTENVTNASSTAKTNYNVGDVIRVNVIRRIKTMTRLARIRAVKIDEDRLQILKQRLSCNDPSEQKQNDDDGLQYFGIEYFNWRTNSQILLSSEDIEYFNNSDFKQGAINDTQIFDVKKPGYGDFISSQQIIGSPLWTRSKSKKALKLKQFDLTTFIKAARFGSMPVVKHMMQMDDYSNNPSLTPSNDKMSAISNAIFGNHFDIVQLLLDSHSAQDDIKENAMASDGHIDSGEYILPKVRKFKSQRNCDVFWSTDGRTKFYNPDPKIGEVLQKVCPERRDPAFFLF